jgi:hypothetical protein
MFIVVLKMDLYASTSIFHRAFQVFTWLIELAPTSNISMLLKSYLFISPCLLVFKCISVDTLILHEVCIMMAF